MANRPHHSWRGPGRRLPYTSGRLRRYAWMADVARRRQSGSALHRINAQNPNRMTSQSACRTTRPVMPCGSVPRFSKLRRYLAAFFMTSVDRGGWVMIPRWVQWRRIEVALRWPLYTAHLRCVLQDSQRSARQQSVGRSQLLHARVVIRVGNRNQWTRMVGTGAECVVLATVVHKRRQLGGAIGDGERLIDARQPQRRQGGDLLVSQLEFLVEIGVTDRPQLVEARHCDPGSDARMIQHERGEMTAG